VIHHPAETLLNAHAEGRVPLPLAVAIRLHAELCQACAARLAALDELGGLRLERAEPAMISEGLLEAVMADIEAPAPDPRPFEMEALHDPLPPGPVAADIEVPPVLRTHIGDRLDAVAWQDVEGLFERYPLPLAADAWRASLLRLCPGGHIPPHGHDGEEYLVVVTGAFTANGRRFVRGDFVHAGAGDHHDAHSEDGCVCLFVACRPLRFDPDYAKLDAVL